MSILIDTPDGLYSMKEEELLEIIATEFSNYRESKLDDKLKKFVLKKLIEELEKDERYYDLPQLQYAVKKYVKKYKGF